MYLNPRKAPNSYANGILNVEPDPDAAEPMIGVTDLGGRLGFGVLGKECKCGIEESRFKEGGQEDFT